MTPYSLQKFFFGVLSLKTHNNPVSNNYDLYETAVLGASEEEWPTTPHLVNMEGKSEQMDPCANDYPEDSG